MAKRKPATVRKSPKSRKRVPTKNASRRSLAARAAPPGTSPNIIKRIQDLNQEQVALERAIQASREKTLAAYRSRFAKFQTLRKGAAKYIFAEGDSWFNYPLGCDVICQLEDLIQTPIANFAWPGAETRQLLALHERLEIEKRLRDGPEKHKKWDVLLFSGGGDDIVGDQMVLFLDHYDPTKPPEAVLNARFDEVLDLVMGAYKDLVALRNQHSPNTLIIGHVYDYAWATGKGACWLGPWLRPSLDYIGVPRGAMQHAVLIEMLKRFDTRLHGVAGAAGNFLVVNTHDTLQTEGEWANELHPKDRGFGLIAQKFQRLLEERFGANF